jgi:hypothetical protein
LLGFKPHLVKYELGESIRQRREQEANRFTEFRGTCGLERSRLAMVRQIGKLRHVATLREVGRRVYHRLLESNF